MRPFFVFTALALATACGFQPDAGLKVVVPALPTTLDWSHSDPTSWVNYPVMLATQKGLTTLGEDHTVQPGLAESWTRERTPEGHERYTFRLRPDVRWSDGTTPLTADDFVYAWRRALRGAERGEMADLLGADEVLRLQEEGAPEATIHQALERVWVKALDPHTLQVTLAHPRGYFLARVANVYLFFPAPSRVLAALGPEQVRDYFDRPRDGHPLALGPYRVERWDRAGERVRLVLNPHSAFLPQLNPGERHAPVVTLLRSEIGPALYERGRVGFVFVDSAAALRGARPPDLQRAPLLSTYFLAFNTERPPLDRPETRRALAEALDPEALLAGLLPAPRVGRTLLPPELPLASTPEEAARLPRHCPDAPRLTLPGPPLRLVYRAGSSFVPEEAIAERIAAQLARAGVQVVLDGRSDFSAEISRRAPDGARAYHLYLRRLGADYAHPNTFFTLFEPSGAHHTGWETQEGGAPMRRFTRLLAEADAEADPARARALYAQAEALLVGEQAVIAPLYHPDRYTRAHPSLRGLTVNPFNFLSLSALRVAEGPGR